MFLPFGCHSLFSQTDTSAYFNKTLSRNNLSIELGGEGYLYSVGYERTLLRSKKIMLATTIGLSYNVTGFDALIIPVGVYAILGEKRNKLLFGAHFTNMLALAPYPKTRKERQEYRSSGESKWGKYEPPYRLLFFDPSIGYRRYFKNGNSLSFTCMYLIYNRYGSINIARDAIPWLGLNFTIKI